MTTRGQSLAPGTATSASTMCMSLNEYVNKRISLITLAQLRYEGRLVSADLSGVRLQQVHFHGTEDRDAPVKIDKKPGSYEFVVFKASEIKTFAPSQVNDSAIVDIGTAHAKASAQFGLEGTSKTTLPTSRKLGSRRSGGRRRRRAAATGGAQPRPGTSQSASSERQQGFEKIVVVGPDGRSKITYEVPVGQHADIAKFVQTIQPITRGQQSSSSGRRQRTNSSGNYQARRQGQWLSRYAPRNQTRQSLTAEEQEKFEKEKRERKAALKAQDEKVFEASIEKTKFLQNILQGNEPASLDKDAIIRIKEDWAAKDLDDTKAGYNPDASFFDEISRKKAGVTEQEDHWTRLNSHRFQRKFNVVTFGRLAHQQMNRGPQRRRGPQYGQMRPMRYGSRPPMSMGNGMGRDYYGSTMPGDMNGRYYRNNYNQSRNPFTHRIGQLYPRQNHAGPSSTNYSRRPFMAGQYGESASWTQAGGPSTSVDGGAGVDALGMARKPRYIDPLTKQFDELAIGKVDTELGKAGIGAQEAGIAKA